MSDGKSHDFRPPLYHGDGRRGGTTRSENAGRRDNPAQQVREQKGWDAYRKWLTSVSNKPQTERAPVDASIYSWKGYHNWADRVRQSWKADES